MFNINEIESAERKRRFPLSDESNEDPDENAEQGGVMPGFPPVHGRFSGRPQHQVIGRFILFAAGSIWKAVCGMDLKSEDAEQIQHQRENRESGRAERENAIEQLRRDSSSVSLWKAVIAFAGETFKTSGRGSRPGIQFTYRVSEPGSRAGRRYAGETVDGYGNELWIRVNDKEQKKSISRSTVDLAYSNAREIMMTEGKVSGPKKLRVPGAGSYLYCLFIRFGVIKVSSDGEK